MQPFKNLLLAVLLGFGLGLKAAPFPSSTFAISHVRLFDGNRVWPDETVVVQDGKITAVGHDLAIPASVPAIDGSGKTLLPGLIDAHVHAYPDNALVQSASLGVTTVLDMFNSPDRVREDKARENKGVGLDGADIFSSGILATVPHGHGTEYGFDIPTLTQPEQAAHFVDERIAEGSDYIKIILENGKWINRPIPTLDEPTVKALVAAAHHRNKLAVAHIGSAAEAREAVEAGVDGLMHLFIDKMPDPDFGAFVAAHHVFVVPTLSVLQSIGSNNPEGKSLAADSRISAYVSADDIDNLQRSFGTSLALRQTLHYEAAAAAIRQLKAAGAPILAGTDAPNPGTAFGASLQGELELLVQAGLTPEEALAAATSRPADCFGLRDRGRILPGRRADLLLVSGDPTVNIKDSRNIVAVWKSGHAVQRLEYAAAVAGVKKAEATPVDAKNATISDFEDGTDHAQFGAGWSDSTDSIFGGQSSGKYEVVDGGADGTRKSLHITGEIAGGLPYAWSGALFSPGPAPFASANLSRHSGVRFWSKGDGKTYRFLYFTKSGGQLAQVATFVAGPEWKQFDFPFAGFSQSDGSDVTEILFCGGPTPGKFSFQIDQVSLTPKP
jgi:imidazolonepropionase-like amidohydrolase